MRCPFRPSSLVPGLAAGVLLAAFAAPAGAQLVAPDYELTAPTWLLPASRWAEPELSPRLPLATWGPVRLSAAGATTGSGLSLEAGEQWFARAGLGRSLDSDLMSLGGGYRFARGDVLSMQLTRQVGQDRLGLAVRYDLQRSYLRLGYDQPLHTPGAGDRLRFSAGVRF